MTDQWVDTSGCCTCQIKLDCVAGRTLFIHFWSIYFYLLVKSQNSAERFFGSKQFSCVKIRHSMNHCYFFFLHNKIC